MSRSTNVLFAAITGFVAGILLAPKSGAETREEIRNKAREAKDRIDEKAGETMGALKDGASRAEAEVRGMAESAKRSARSVAGEADSLKSETRERASRAARKE